MRLGLFVVAVWATAVGAVFTFTPKKPTPPPAEPVAGVPAVSIPAPPPAADVVDVLDLNPLLDPPPAPVVAAEPVAAAETPVAFADAPPIPPAAD